MQQVLIVITVVTVGLMTGVELAVAALVNPIFDRLPEEGGVAARADAARVLGRVMPFWYAASVVLVLGCTALWWGRPEVVLLAVGAGLLVVSIVMSALVLVPINSRVARWAAGDAPADWRQQVRRWDRFHFLRVGIIVIAFALVVVAA